MAKPTRFYSLYRYLPWLATALILFGVSSRLVAQEAQSLADAIVQQIHTDDLSEMKLRKRIRALVTYSRTDFFFDGNGEPRGAQVDLLQAFEKQLNKGVKREIERVRIEFIPTTFDRMIADLVAGKGDIAAAMLTLTPEREQKITFITDKKQHISELVVTHKSVSGITSVDDLSGRKLYVLRGSSYVDHLRKLNETFRKKKLKPIDIVEAEHNQLTEDILELVNAGVVKITVADDYKAKLWAQALPDIQPIDTVAISTGNAIGWGIRKNNPELQKALQTFLHEVHKGTLLGNMIFKRYYVKDSWIDNPNAEEDRKKLQALIQIFKKYGERYEFDYLANAAQGYQESRLDQSMKSGSGAMGIMQLLPSTAATKNVGIPDISKKEDNIHAGVKYMAFLRDRYFNDPAISAENRMALTLAAYNAGPAKVNEMRNLARKMNLDPNVWHANVEVAAGKIVGRQTVEYVSNIFKYYIAYKLVDEQYKQTM
jgi:membrane-bound lytic murein transglycosylase MltF